MKILLTGATGYIGKRLLYALIDQGHHVVCCVRDPQRFNPPELLKSHIDVIQVDFLETQNQFAIPKDIQAAYYLMHSMSTADDYMALEQKVAKNFISALEKTSIVQVIYLSGIINEQSLSKHLTSRKTVEEELGKGDFHLTTLRAGIIIGSGSASFEIIRDLVEKLPVMITPRWLLTRSQPIGVKDVITFLSKSLLNPATYDRNFDIGGPEIMSYRQMLLGFAAARGLKRTIWIVPVMTPKLSSYWLYFVTSISYKLAAALVDSMKVEVVCRDNELNLLLNIHPMNYRQALDRSFQHIEDHQIISSWKDSFVSGLMSKNISEFITVPSYGCFKDRRQRKMTDPETILERVWRIGGGTGWYYADWLWHLRGFMDKLVGGVGLRRGRTHDSELSPGDAVDFWRVLVADRSEGRLLLFAEMKLPGEAWLEFQVEGDTLHQTATFRPRGLFGRLYWYAVYPLHGFIFSGMLRNLTRPNRSVGARGAQHV